MPDIWSTALLRQGRALFEAIQHPRALTPSEQRRLSALAERHGVAGVLVDAWTRSHIPVDRELARSLGLREAARELDREAQLGLLAKIDGAFERASLRGVVLKGALLASRLYEHPAARATSDVDLLVDARDLDAAAAALESIGFRGRSDPEEERFRREHHHLHFDHPHATMVELHFHAYSAFGRVLPSAPLVARSIAAPAGLRCLNILAPDDELAFLAIHAAAHRFVRLAWSLDLALLASSVDGEVIAQARRRAGEAGFGHAFELAGAVLGKVAEGLLLDASRVALFGDENLRTRALVHLVGEPSPPAVRAASRFVFTLGLAETPGDAARYAWRAVRDRVRLAR